jgi:hypothetical protein
MPVPTKVYLDVGMKIAAYVAVVGIGVSNQARYMSRYISSRQI